MATFWGIANHSVDHVFYLYFVFEGWVWNLFVSVPDLCILFTFNVAECHSMRMTKHFPDNQIQFEQIQSAKYLGITITDNLDCGQHISEISCKATRQCGLIGAIVRWHIVVYKTLLRPKFSHLLSQWYHR